MDMRRMMEAARGAAALHETAGSEKVEDAVGEASEDWMD
jgi:hypothetical protein